MENRLFDCFGFNDIPFTEGQLVDFVYAVSPRVALTAFMARAIKESDLNEINFYSLDYYFFTMISASGFAEYRRNHTYIAGEFDRYRVLELKAIEGFSNESC